MSSTFTARSSCPPPPCLSPLFLSVSFRTPRPPFSSERSLARSTYRLRGIISPALCSQHAYPLEVRVTATPAAPARSAIELMMLGPRRFNNKPHYLQSALGSITTGCPPHLVAGTSPHPTRCTLGLPSSPPLLLSPPRAFTRRRRAAGRSYVSGRRLTLPHRKCPRSDIKPL